MRVFLFIMILLFFTRCTIEESEIEGVWCFRDNIEYQNQSIFLFLKDGKLLYWNENSPNFLYRQKYTYDNGCVTTFYMGDANLEGDTADFPGSFCIEKATREVLLVNANGVVYKHVKVSELFNDDFIQVQNNDSMLLEIFRMKEQF